MFGSLGGEVMNKPSTAPEHSPARNRLKRLLMHRVERKVASTRGTPTPLPADEKESVAAAIESSLRRAQKNALVVDQLAGDLLRKEGFALAPVSPAVARKSFAGLPPRSQTPAGTGGFPFGSPLAGGRPGGDLPPVPATPTASERSRAPSRESRGSGVGGFVVASDAPSSAGGDGAASGVPPASAKAPPPSAATIAVPRAGETATGAVGVGGA